MNQKYLQGLSSLMPSRDSAVFFEATPENISAFLILNQAAPLSAIGTANNLTFLTARMGFIDICPDQEYLREKLLPVYARVQMGELPVPPLITVPKEQALAEPCPRPDWNYLRWDGCSDKKYQSILGGEGLLELGGTAALEVQVRAYYNGGGLCLQLVDWSSGDPKPWEDLTTHHGPSCDRDCAFVDVKTLGVGVLPWIENNGLGKPTGRTAHCESAVYPEYRFDARRLRELDDYGYGVYASLYDQRMRSRQQRKAGQER